MLETAREKSASVGSEGGTLDAGLEVERQELEEDVDDDDENETGSEDHPLLILYDCEATGFSVYSDHITDIGAKVIAAPTPLLHCTFSSLVRTPRTIPAAGKKKKIMIIIIYNYFNIIAVIYSVTRLTGIS